jgi:hypothetical protein
VIDVRVRQHDCIDLADFCRQGFVLDGGLAASSLKHSAVERHRMPIDVQQVTRPRYFTGRAYERDFQVLPLSDCAA